MNGTQKRKQELIDQFKKTCLREISLQIDQFCINDMFYNNKITFDTYVKMSNYLDKERLQLYEY